jgi:hypothetical protein
MNRLACGTCVASMSALLSSVAWAQTVERVSVATSGAEGNGNSGWCSTSELGRFVVFWSSATNLVLNDNNGVVDLFVRDTDMDTTVRVSVSSLDEEANGGSGDQVITPDGNFVTFDSVASNLVPLDTNGVRDVFVRNRSAGTTVLVSKSTGGLQGNAGSRFSTISANGQFVSFFSNASNLDKNDLNGATDVFVRDLGTGTTTLVSVTPSGVSGNGPSTEAYISGDGRFVGFVSLASDLVGNDTNGSRDIFVRDLVAGATERVSVGPSLAQANAHSYYPWLSSDGNIVAFYSLATNLVSGDTNLVADVFVHDRQLDMTELVSVGLGGTPAIGESLYPSLSANGRFVAFGSVATNLVTNVTSGAGDIFVRDRHSGTTELVSQGAGGAQANAAIQLWPAISPDGRFVTIHRGASNLVQGDTNGVWDSFQRDRALVATRYCTPANSNSTGQAAVIGATGNNAVLANAVQLSVSQLPQNSFGFFLTSRTQGFIANAGGSQGNLCLSGSIGRFVGPGQIMNSGPMGSFSLPVDLNGVPTPTGPVAVTPGDTWNYQAWFRDAVGGVATSNFTDALGVTFQ